MVVINTSENIKQIDTDKFKEILSEQQKLKNVISEKIWILDSLIIEPLSISILEIIN